MYSQILCNKDLANPLLLHKSLSEFRRQRVPSSPERLQGEPSVGEEGLDQTATSVKSKKGILQTCPSVAGPSSSAKKCPKDYFPNVASPTRKFLSQIGRSSSSSASSVSPSRHSSNSGKTIKGSPKQLHKKALSPILTPKEELEVDILNIQWVSVNRDRQERIPWRGDVGLIVCNATPGDAISSLSLPSLLESGVKNEEGQRLVLTEPVFSDLIEKDVSFPPSSGSNQSSNVTLGADSPEEEQTDSGLFLEFSRSRSKTEESLSPALSRQSSQATLFPNGASSGHGTAALCSSDSALPVLKEDVGGDDDVATLNPIRRSFTEPKRLSDLARSDTWTPSFFTGKQKSEFPVSNTNGQKKLGKSKTVHEPYKGLSRKDSTTQHILYYDPILEASWKSQGTFNRSDSFSKPARGQRASSTISSTGTVGSALSRQVSGKRASRRSSSITSPRHLWNWFQSSSSSVSPPVSPHPPAPPPSPVLSPSRSPGYLSIGHPASGHFAEDQN